MTRCLHPVEKKINKKIVLVILPSISVGGMEVNRIRLVKGFLARDWDVRVLVLYKSSGKCIEVPGYVPLEYLDIRRLISLPLALLNRYGSLEGHIVLVGMWPLTFMLAILRLFGFLKCKLILSEHVSINSMFENYKNFRKFIFDASLFLSVLGADRYVFLTEALRREFYQRLPRNLPLKSHSLKIRVIGNPFIQDSIRFSSAAVTYDAAWSEESKGRRIACIGRLKPQKNHQLLVRSFAALKDTRAELLIAGEDGGSLTELRVLISELGMEKKIGLIGHVENPSAFLATADVFVSPSNYEGMSNVVIEAMIAGLKIFATDCPGGPQEFLDQYAGLTLFRVNDSSELTSLLMEHFAKGSNDKYVFSVPKGSTCSAYIDSYERLLEELSGKL